MANGNRQQTVIAGVGAKGRPETRRPRAGAKAVPAGERVPPLLEGLSWRARMDLVIPLFRKLGLHRTMDGLGVLLRKRTA